MSLMQLPVRHETKVWSKTICGSQKEAEGRRNCFLFGFVVQDKNKMWYPRLNNITTLPS